jgi:hypothetical protein
MMGNTGEWEIGRLGENEITDLTTWNLEHGTWNMKFQDETNKYFCINKI